MKMKKVFLFFVCITIATIALAQKATDNFVGKYKTEEGVVITITKTATGFIGKDHENNIVLKDVKFDGKEWKAIVYNPKKDITATCELLLENNKLKIVAHKGFLSKTIYWEIIKK